MTRIEDAAENRADPAPRAPAEEVRQVHLGARGDTHLSTLRALAGETSIEGVIEKLGRRDGV